MVDIPTHGAAVEVDQPLASEAPASVAVHTSASINSRAMRLTTLGAATALAAGLAGWAIWSGDSLPTTLMLLYGMVASSLALYASTAVPAVEAAPVPTQDESVSPGTSEAWKLVETLTVSDASRLWCSIEPGAAATQETIAWGRALLDAITREELPIVVKPGAPKDVLDWERKNPHYQTQVTRASLKVWANEHGHFPAFLQD